MGIKGPAQRREDALRRREALREHLAAKWGAEVWLVRLGPTATRYEVPGRRSDGSRSDTGTVRWLLRRAALPLLLLAQIAPERNYVVRGAEGSGAVRAVDSLPVDTLANVWVAGTSSRTAFYSLDLEGTPTERYAEEGAQRPILDDWTLRWPDSSVLEIELASAYAENEDA